MNKMVSIGLSIIMNLCFNSIFIIRDVHVRFLIVLLIREALVDGMWWQSATVGVRIQQEVFLFPIQSSQVVLQEQTFKVLWLEAAEPGGGQWYLLKILARFGYF